MIWIRLFTLFVIFTFAGTVFGAEISTNEPRWKQLMQAYGFVSSQQAFLDLIAKDFPELAREVKEAWFAFNSTALGESVTGVEQELSKILDDKWEDFKKVTASGIDSLTGGQKLSREQAVSFLKEVRLRAKGQMPESILSTLLSAQPRFLRNPRLELSEGWKQTYRTKNHPKAKGVDFSISFPASWSRREGSRPNIIQVFQSGAGHGPIICSLMVKTLPSDYKQTQEEWKVLFKPNVVKKTVPKGSTFIEAKETVLEGLPAGILVMDNTQKRLDTEIKIRMTQFMVGWEKSMILIQFMATKMPDSHAVLDDLQKQFMPTFNDIANTLMLNDLYN